MVAVLSFHTSTDSEVRCKAKHLMSLMINSVYKMCGKLRNGMAGRRIRKYEKIYTVCKLCIRKYVTQS